MLEVVPENKKGVSEEPYAARSEKRLFFQNAPGSQIVYRVVTRYLFMQRTPLKRKTGLRSKSPIVRVKDPSKRVRIAWKPPSWVGCIPQGSHGNTSMQKKFWKMTSDYVRIKDFNDYGGTCPGCRMFRFHTWKDGDCGHFKSWGASHCYAKYMLINLALICSGCNKNEDGIVGHNFGEELRKRYGSDVKERIEDFNRQNAGARMEDVQLVGRMEEMIHWFKELEDKPDYWNTLISNYDKHNQAL